MKQIKHLLFVSALTAAVVMLSSCSDDVSPNDRDSENSVPGQEVGIKTLKVSVPRLKRFDGVVERLSCRIHLRGRKDQVTYPINTFISADKDSLYLEANDPILAELPHQMYHLNAVTFPHRDVTTRSDEQVEDTVYVGARLSIEDPDNIGFRSSFNVSANSIGSGTEDDPWIIASGDDFMLRISDAMTRGETHEGEFFEITRNINLNTAAVATGKGWEPAGHNNINGGSTDFNGTIDGCDNYIENLFCFTDAGCGGLFYSLGEKAYIHNLEMRRVMLNGNSYVGAFGCTSKKGCRLEKVEVNGTIQGFEKTGALIGSGDADVTHCISSANISCDGEGKYIGGMIGESGNSSFADCIRTGLMDAGGADNVGGYVGGSDSKNINSFTRCYVGGIINSGRHGGGFVGESYAEFTDCHAAATLPQDSYTYSTRWDIFNLNNRMTPMPLEMKGGLYTGGFIGSSDKLILHGDNSFLYENPAKPSISAVSHMGALAGRCDYYGDDNATFTSYAFIEGAAPESSGMIGGIFGNVDMYAGGTFINHGNISSADNYVGGVFGSVDINGDFKLKCKNTGNVKGTALVGGIAGSAECYIEGCMENEGNVEGTGDSVGGLFGQNYAMSLDTGSHVGSENGSLKITGQKNVGGIVGLGKGCKNKSLCRSYCPVYANIIGSSRVGGLYGYLQYGWGKEQLFDVHYPVKVSITSDGGHVGGVIGSFVIMSRNLGNIQVSGFNDKLQASISTSGSGAGGIIGYADLNEEDNNTLTLSNCDSFTSITSNASGEVTDFGGIVGICKEFGKNCSAAINFCSYHGAIGGQNIASAGGIIGYCDGKIAIEKCYNAGNVNVSRAVGGIFGRLAGEGSIKYCFNMGSVPKVSGCKYLAGIIGQKESNSSQLTIEQCYNTGSTGWGIIGGEDGCKRSVKDTYYLNSASDGDMSNSGAQSKTADEMRRKDTYKNWNTAIWSIDNGGNRAPVLNGMSLYGKKAPLQK